jgi:predicted DCC family thiol-disulfide oxidoreductase YuxK
MTLGGVIRGWKTFWFAPEPTTAIGLYRILYGLLTLVTGALLAPDLLVWFGERGMLSPMTVRGLDWWWHLNLFYILPSGDGWVIAFFAVFMLSAVCLTLGLFTRTSAALVYLGLASMHGRNPYIFHSGDTLLRVVAFFLIFSQAGASLSLDRLRRVVAGTETGPPEPKAPWAQRLIQVQLAAVYLSTFLAKATGSMWVDGTALYYVSRIEEFWRFPVPYVFEHLWSIKLLTWGTLLLEVLMGTLLWFAETRYVTMVLGTFLHLGIEYAMNVPVFEWAMIATFVTFVEPAHLTGAMERLRAWVAGCRGQPSPVFYDGDCTFCIGNARAVGMLDLFRRIQLVDFRAPGATAAWPDFDAGRAEQELLIRTRQGTWLGGFHAFRWMAWRLPLLWWLAPILSMPGVAVVGVPLYAWVSRRRFLLSGRRCADGSCRLHAGGPGV